MTDPRFDLRSARRVAPQAHWLDADATIEQVFPVAGPRRVGALVDPHGVMAFVLDDAPHVIELGSDAAEFTGAERFPTLVHRACHTSHRLFWWLDDQARWRSEILALTPRETIVAFDVLGRNADRCVAALRRHGFGTDDLRVITFELEQGGISRLGELVCGLHSRFATSDGCVIVAEDRTIRVFDARLVEIEHPIAEALRSIHWSSPSSFIDALQMPTISRSAYIVERAPQGFALWLVEWTDGDPRASCLVRAPFLRWPRLSHGQDWLSIHLRPNEPAHAIPLRENHAVVCLDMPDDVGPLQSGTWMEGAHSFAATTGDALIEWNLEDG